MTVPLEIKTVAQSALANAVNLLGQWLPEGQVQGDEYVARNPTRDDHHTGSFKINIKTGCWGDFATDDKGGDLVLKQATLLTKKIRIRRLKLLHKLSRRSSAQPQFGS